MYSSYTMRRTQIYLEPDRWLRIVGEAERLGVTASELIRRAVDRFLDEALDDAESRAEVIRDLRRHPISRLPDGASYVEQLRASERGREGELWRPR